MFQSVLSNKVATNHMWPVSTQNTASVTEKMEFNNLFNFSYLYLFTLFKLSDKVYINFIVNYK